MSKGELVLCARGLGKSWHLNRPGRLARLRSTRENASAEFWALQDVDLELRRGEALGVVGENGAGKSTLLRLLCGTLRPTTGTVRVAGRIAALLELGAGFNPNFTGRENVWLNAAVLGLSKNEIAERFDAIAAFAGIGGFMDLPVRLYSSGMQARLAFAVSAHVDADILIVDEILAVGDAAFAQKCTAHLERFRKRGTLLFVSHNTGSVTRLCDRALWLDHGRVREIGPAGDVCAHYLANIAEESPDQGSNAKASGSRRWTLLDPPPVIRDTRQLVRNTITLSPFNREAPWHGYGGAQITDVSFCNASGTGLQEVNGGDEVALRIVCHAERALGDPIVGFLFRDRLGQNVFGDSTYLACRDRPRAVEAGDEFVAEFRFQLPFLARGEYALTVAITEGTQEDHIHIHWIEEAVTLDIQASPVRHGIIGLPAVSIEIEKDNSAEAA